MSPPHHRAAQKSRGERVLRVVKNRLEIRELLYSCIPVETRMTNLAASDFSMHSLFAQGISCLLLVLSADLARRSSPMQQSKK